MKEIRVGRVHVDCNAKTVNIDCQENGDFSAPSEDIFAAMVIAGIMDIEHVKGEILPRVKARIEQWKTERGLEDRQVVRATLEHWQRDADLWADVAEVLKKANNTK
jgi:hypothetical protein